jgi:hypothetical protein
VIRQRKSFSHRLGELRAECGAVQVSAGLRIKTVQLSLRKQQRMAGLD